MYKEQRLREDEEQCIVKSNNEKLTRGKERELRLDTQCIGEEESQRCPARVRAGRRRGRVCGRAGFYGGYCFYHALRKNDSIIAMQQETPETIGKTEEKNEKRETLETVGKTDEKNETLEKVGEIKSFEKADSEKMAGNAEIIVENTEIIADDDDFFGDAEQGVKRYRHAGKSRLRRLFERLFKRFKKA